MEENKNQKIKEDNSLFEKFLWIQNQSIFLQFKNPKDVKGNLFKEWHKEVIELFELFILTYNGVFGININISNSLYKVENEMNIEEYFAEVINIVLKLRKGLELLPCLTNILDNITTLTYKYTYLIKQNS